MNSSPFSAPIEFELYNEDQEPNLLLTDETQGQPMTLVLTNTSQEQIAYDQTIDHHFELVFRPATLVNPQQIAVESTGYTLVGTPIANGDGTLSVFIKSNEERRWNENEQIELSGLKVEAGIGTRSTRMMLRYQHLKHGAGDFSGHLETQLHIVNSLGRINIPLQVGFVGDNHVLNDGSTESTLTIRVTNPERIRQAVGGGDGARLVLVIPTGPRDEEWTLGTNSQVDGIRIHTVYHNGERITAAQDLPFISDLVSYDSVIGSNERIIGFNTLEPGGFMDIEISNIISGHPTGHTNLLLHYENIPGYRDGQFVLVVEKSPLIIRQHRLGLGTTSPAAKLHIIDEPGEPNEGTLILGPTGSNSNLRMGFHERYSWIQSHGSKPLAINPIGSRNNVGIGTNSPSAKLEVHPDPNKEGITIRSTTAGNTHLPHSSNWNYIAGKGVLFSYFDDTGHHEKVRIDLRSGRVGIGTNTPDSAIQVIREEGTKGISITDKNNPARTRLPDDDNWHYLAGNGLIIRDQGNAEKVRLDARNGDVTVRGALVTSSIKGRNTGSGLNWEILSQGEGIDIREPEDGNKVWLRILDDKGLHLKGAPNLYADGRIGIGTTSPARKLHIANSGFESHPGIRIDGGVGPVPLGNTGRTAKGIHYWEILVDADDADDQDLLFRLNGKTKFIMEPGGDRVRVSSDERLKKDIEPLESVLEKVCALIPSRYRWKEDAPEKEKDMGFIAQEVEQLFPHLVKEKEGFKNISYTDFGILAIAAIKEQQSEIDTLKQEMADQRKMIEQLIKNQMNN